MKKETYENKLASLLGIAEKVEELKPKNQVGKLVGIPEEQIQSFRQAQGIFYFLQAPELFSARICRHCEQPFLVSRHQVAHCSYTCIRLDLEKIGLTFSRGDDYELNTREVFENNEPIWIKKIDVIRKLIDSVDPQE